MDMLWISLDIQGLVGRGVACFGFVASIRVHERYKSPPAAREQQSDAAQGHGSSAPRISVGSAAARSSLDAAGAL